MPTILRKNGFRFFFYSHEGHEPPHIHVIGHGGEAKLWLAPVKFSRVYNLKPQSRKQILRIVQDNVMLFLIKYKEYHELEH
ncbi:MAG: DUF4160 domain-containing protein [Bacteriovoracaceae bacterium]